MIIAPPLTPTPARRRLWLPSQPGLRNAGACGCCGSPTPTPTCTSLPCNLPLTDLTVSYVNPVSGNGSFTLPYTGSNSWQCQCCGPGSLIYGLACNSPNTLQFTVTYFTGGTCPTGTTATCSNDGGPGNQLTLSSYTCSPLSLTFTATEGGCPVLVNGGFESFTISL